MKPRQAGKKAKQKVFAIARWRIVSVLLIIAVLPALLVWHVAMLQVVPGNDRGYEFLQRQGDVRSVRTESIAANRGSILDRNGEPLALSTPVVSLWANPKQVLAEPSQLSALAAALSTTEARLRDKMQRHFKKEFIYLKRNLSPQDADDVLAGGWAGVYGRTEYQRYYPAAEVTAQLVGFTNIDERGQEGMELAYDSWLTGKSGRKQVIRDLKGRVIRDNGIIEAPAQGKDIELSIDLRLQYLAYRELKQAVTNHRAKSGSLVMLDAKTGEVLAMVNQPSFNPNNRRGMDLSAVRNRAITDQIEPGSTMKPLTVMAALESGLFRPESIIDTSPGYMRVGRKTLLDPKNYGRLDLTHVITKSSQVGISKVALSMEPETIRDMFYRTGLGQGTGVGFPGEGIGILPARAHWSRIEQANFSFGYGMSVSALQLAQAYSVIANGGIKKPVSLLRRDEAPEGERVVAENIALQTREMLKTVLQSGGTGHKAQIVNYPAAGKTGTVHKVGANGYADDRYRSVFAGMAPANNPSVVTIVVIEEPTAGKYFGGEVAGPVFSRVVDGALRMLHVPPELPSNENRGILVNNDKDPQKRPLS